MQLRRFTGDSMPAALAAVRETLGAEAIIVSNREVDGRIELIATGTIDEEALSGARDAESIPEPTRPMPGGPEDPSGVSVSLSEASHAVASSVSVRAPEKGAWIAADPTVPKPDGAPPVARHECDAGVATEGVDGIAGAEDAAQMKDETRASSAETRSVIDNLTRDLAAMAEEERPLLLDSAASERAWELDCDRTGTPPAAARPAPEVSAALARGGGCVTPEPGSSTVVAIAQVLAGAERRHAERARRLEQRLGRLEVNLWGELEPLKAAHLRQLVRLGIGMELAVRLIERIGPGMNAETAMRQSLALLKSTLLTGVDGTGDVPGVTVLSGPAGGGKTTALAKLAIRQVREAGNQSLVIISADNRRIGAFESLQVYGRLLGVPILRVRDASELAELLVSLAHKPLVLVDHVPLGRDDALSFPGAARLGEFEGKARALRHLLVLPATLEARAFESEVAAHRAHGITHGVLMQLDRATRIGACFAPLIRHRLPLAWLSDDDCVRSPLTKASGTSLVAAATTVGWRTAACADESFVINLMQPTRSIVGEPSARRTETRMPETSSRPAESDGRESGDEAPRDPSIKPVSEVAGEVVDRVDADARDEGDAADEPAGKTDIAASRDARSGDCGQASTRPSGARGERLGSYGLSILATRSRRLQRMETGTTR